MKRVQCFFLSDELYRRKKFLRDFGFQPDMVNPKTFNEKIMYRMLSDRNPLFNRLTDKLKAREHVCSLAGEKYLIPLHGVYWQVSEIDFLELPAKFVFKCNHSHNSTIICSRERFDSNAVLHKLKFFMKINMYYFTREWQYQGIEPLIMCEKYIDRSRNIIGGYYADVYRVHCFDGIPVCLEVDYIDEKNQRYTSVYDSNWDLLPVTLCFPNCKFIQPKPQKLQELLVVAKKITKRIDYCRADFFLTEDQIYFCAFSFSPSNGGLIFKPNFWDYNFGSYWSLNRSVD